MTIVTSSARRDLVFWLVWWLVVLVALFFPWRTSQTRPQVQPLAEIWQSRCTPFPWLGATWGWRWALAGWQVRQWIHQGQAGLGLALRVWGCRNLAEIITALTRRQVTFCLGALPVLIPLLERLQVQAVVDRHCPTQSRVKHGAIVLGLVLNRLMTPQPLYKVADWLAGTMLSTYLGVPASKFNDDRLGRTLDALAPHLPVIWQDLQQAVMRQNRLDLSVLFYDLTALVMSGEYPDSQLVDFGFAHNTPSDQRKVKLTLTACQDGAIPILFHPWSGRAADKSTVKTHLDQLRTALQRHGWDMRQVLLVGDSANLSSELALVYDDARLRYLTSLGKLEKVHRELILLPSPEQFEQLPLAPAGCPKPYWGVPCQVPFQHQGKHITQRGLIVLSGSMRDALRQKRRAQLTELHQALHKIQGKLNQKYYRSEKEVRHRVNVQLKRSPVNDLIEVRIWTTPEGQVGLEWWLNQNAKQAAERKDGRYLLVTNDPHLTYPQMLALYRQKDAIEKRFQVFKQTLKARPLHVHSDERIQALLFINLIALLVYSLLERQAKEQGFCLTAQRLIELLSNWQVHEIEAWDGSRTWQSSQLTAEQMRLLTTWLPELDRPVRPTLPWGRLSTHLLPAGAAVPLGRSVLIQ